MGWFSLPGPVSCQTGGRGLRFNLRASPPTGDALNDFSYCSIVLLKPTADQPYMGMSAVAPMLLPVVSPPPTGFIPSNGLSLPELP